MPKAWAIDDREQLHKDANRALDEHLGPGEEVKVIIRGTSSSAMIGTDRRVFVFKKGVLFGRGLATFEYRDTSGVAIETGLVLGHVSLQGPGLSSDNLDKATHAIVINEKDQARNGVTVLRRLVGESQQRPADGGGPDITDQLRKLGELRNSGVLTTDEFESKKAELLSRL